ncbi:MAG: alpha-amylase family glycosyl hydrolase, partial [Muribaculaceae bacterium]
MKKFTKSALLLLLVLIAGVTAKAAGWPSNYHGVMLQGFYWDSYSDSKWTVLTANADEYSQYFSLIWVPNSARAGSGNQMGYMPQYWFTNHNSSFGTEEQLRTMIQTYKDKGVGFIEDVVINHRNGVTGWYDFPTEEWNGTTWHIGLEGICCNDNLAGSGQGNPTGNYDTGEQFDGCRDLDHTNANVQNNCKNYCKFLLDDLGYVGFRLDMVKGYSGQYTKLYNEYSNPQFSVGEYFDGSYDAVAGWIESTGKTSAAFDFPLKFALNDAFNNNDMTKLVWYAEYKTPQPAGLIHWWYPQYAVTFVDNHDTYKDHNKFNGPVVAANAFILCSPGTPCVLLAHYKQYKQEIQRLINIRNSVGLHNQSAVTVLQTDNSCYMAEVAGTNGKLVVKIGPAMVSPDGYTNDDIVASGDNYCVWTKVKIEGGTSDGGNGGTVSMPSQMYLMGHISQGAWKTNAGITMTKEGNTFVARDVTIVDAGEGKNLGFFSFVTALGTTGDSSEWDAVINSSDRYGATSKDAPIAVGGSAPFQAFFAGVDASSAYSWAIAPGTYDIVADFSTMTVSVVEQGGVEPDPDPDPVVDTPANMYIMGHLSQGAWKTNVGVTMTKEGNTFVARDVTIVDAGEGKNLGFFSFVTALGTTGDSSEWDAVINSSDRYGATSKDAPIAVGGSAPFQAFLAGVDASSAYSWAVAPGTYDITADFATMQIYVNTAGGEDPDPTPGEYPDLYIVGYAYGMSAPNDNVMSVDANGVYTITMADLSGGFAISGVGYNPFYSSLNNEMQFETPYACENGTMALMKLGASPKENVTIVFDYNTATVTLKQASSINNVLIDGDDAPIYYNLQGVRVDNPENGIFIEVRGNKTTKIV